MQYLIKALIVIVGIINFLPIIGVISGTRLQALYGLPVDEPNLTVLLRHRALLFGIIGGFIIVSAFVSHLRVAAYIMGFLSMISFIFFVQQEVSVNPQMKKVMFIDILAIALFLIAAIAQYLTSRES